RARAGLREGAGAHRRQAAAGDRRAGQARQPRRLTSARPPVATALRGGLAKLGLAIPALARRARERRLASPSPGEATSARRPRGVTSANVGDTSARSRHTPVSHTEHLLGQPGAMAFFPLPVGRRRAVGATIVELLVLALVVRHVLHHGSAAPALQ